MKHIYLNGAARSVLAVCLAAGALAACNQNSQPQNAPTPSAALPMEMTATGPTAIAPAPTVSALPPAPRARVGRLSNPGDTYAYADDADSQNDAFGDAPPDYGFDYGGTRPWVWRGADQSERVVEPLPGGGDRYYYYQAGAQYPYLVRDPEYSYGYDGGVLVVIYDRRGHALPPQQYDERADAAGRILFRAGALYAASQQNQHQAVVAANWEARQARIAEDNAAWEQGQAQQSEWAAYHAAHAQQEQAQWRQERYMREAEAARFAQAVNQPEVAQRDWQAAQQAHAQGPGGGGPGMFGGHPGGPPQQQQSPPPQAIGGPAAFGGHAGGQPPQQPSTAQQAAAPSPQPANTHPPGGFAPGGHAGGTPGPAAAPVAIAPAAGAQQGGPAGRHDHGFGQPGAAPPTPPHQVAAPGRPMTTAPAASVPATTRGEGHAPPRAGMPAPTAPAFHAVPPQAVVVRPPSPAPVARTVVPPPRVIERSPVAPPPAVVRPPPPVVHSVALPVHTAAPPVHAAPPAHPPAAHTEPPGQRLHERPDDKLPPQ